MLKDLRLVARHPSVGFENQNVYAATVSVVGARILRAVGSERAKIARAERLRGGIEKYLLSRVPDTENIADEDTETATVRFEGTAEFFQGTADLCTWYSERTDEGVREAATDAIDAGGGTDEVRLQRQQRRGWGIGAEALGESLACEMVFLKEVGSILPTQGES